VLARGFAAVVPAWLRPANNPVTLKERAGHVGIAEACRQAQDATDLTTVYNQLLGLEVVPPALGAAALQGLARLDQNEGSQASAQHQDVVTKLARISQYGLSVLLHVAAPQHLLDAVCAIAQAVPIAHRHPGLLDRCV
jgi:hypothetical protein